ncbi:MAG: response regulator [Acidobacteriia bacterium]|nr:response regulator [Terriglobia bacterium]
MSRTILLADDSVTIRKVVELTFGDTDFRVEAVESGREALERLDTLKPDIILADVVMPGPTGYEICKRVKASSRPVPVLLLAGTFEPFDPDRARECGADGHLVKPFESRTLVQRVEHLLARGPRSLAPRVEPAEDLELEAVLDDLAARDMASAPVPSIPPEAEETPWAASSPAVEPEAAAREELHGAVFDAPETPAVPTTPTPLWALEAVATSFEPGATSAGAAEAPALPPPTLEAPTGRTALSPEEIEAIARAVVERLGGEALREVAWEVVPDLAEAVIRERLREIEREEQGRG